MSPPDPITANSAAAVTGAERRVLERVFQHPLSHNLSWRETLALVTAIGTVDHGRNGEVTLRLGDHHQSFRSVRDKVLATEDVMLLRHFLTRAGWAPDAVPAPAPEAIPDDMVVVIDHAAARIYALPAEPGHRGAADAQSVLHAIDRSRRDDNRAETHPADRAFFDAIAAATAGSGRIVVIGHGTGQSREADHLLADLAARHDAVRARIVQVFVADLSHRTVPQLLQAARQALQAAAPSEGDGPA